MGVAREAKLLALEESGKLAKALGELRGGIGAERYVADLAARAEGFAVNVEVGIGDSEDVGWLGQFADQVEHGGLAQSSRVAERQAGYRAEMIFKLAGDGAFDTPVAGIVDTGSHLVGEQLAVTFEEFDGEDADVIESFEDATRGGFGFALQGVGQVRSGSEGEAQDSAAMMIFD